MFAKQFATSLCSPDCQIRKLCDCGGDTNERKHAQKTPLGVITIRSIMEYKFSKRKKPVDILVGVAALPVVRKGRLRRDITSVAHCTPHRANTITFVGALFIGPDKCVELADWSI
jgi:hypothetical protein